MTKPKPKTNRGRPAGSQTQDLPLVQATLPACPRCGSTNRKVLSTKTMNFTGEIKGQVYNKVIWRRCKCDDCGGIRIEKSHET